VPQALRIGAGGNEELGGTVDPDDGPFDEFGGGSLSEIANQSVEREDLVCN